MRSPIFVLLVLLSSAFSKSTPHHETIRPSIAKVPPINSRQSQKNLAQHGRSGRNYNDSESIETLFIPEDPNRYGDILRDVRTFFAQREKPTDPIDQKIQKDVTESTVASNINGGDTFSMIDAGPEGNSTPTAREGTEEKYLQRNSEGVSPRTTAENNKGDVTETAERNNYDSYDEGKIEPREEDLLEVANFGLDAMKDLYFVKEPMLYSMGLYLDTDDPARHLALFNSQTEEARTLAKYGFAVLQSATMLKKKFPDALTNSLLSRRSQINPLQRGCPNRGVPICPTASLRYRTSDGSCNNLQHLWWGSAMSSMQRFLPAVYEDGIQSIRRSVTGRPLPSPRDVTMVIHQDRDVPLSSVTHMLMQWGQFIDHDLTATGQNRGFNGSIPQCCLRFGSGFQPPEFMHPECLPIPVSIQDSFLGPLNVRCLEFVRSGPAPREDCQFGPREQLTQVTSFLDASTVYSSNALLTDSLRIFRNGLLQYGRIQSQRPQLPKLDFDLCRHGSLSTSCFRAGDGRVGEQPALTSLHVAFLRLHNRIATKLAALNVHWNDEKLFQESRRIVGAIVQHITYREFLPIVLGQDVMKIFDLTLLKKGYYEGYDPTVNPTVANAFSTAAYRFGHSMVQQSFVRFDSDHRPIFNNVSIHNEFTNPANLETVGSVDRLLLGLINQPAQGRDEHISEELTNHLFQTPNFPFGMDLASINIQRGRDHGIPPYIQWREPCGLSPIKNFNDLDRVMAPSAARKFKLIYSSVEDIDLFTGGLAEKSVRGGLVGPTFACIIGQQFSNLKKGDRFWYENSQQPNSFTPGQLQQIRRVSLAQVLCATMDNIETVQPFVFLTHDTLRNQRLPCNDPLIGQLNLEFWTERSPELRSITGILDIVKKKITPSTPKPATTLKQDPSGVNKTPEGDRFNVALGIAPPKASVHQINRIIVKKPLGPPDNYTIVVQNNAINSPLFVNDAIHGSSIQIMPTLNQQPQQRPILYDPLPAPTFLPPPRPVPTIYPQAQSYLLHPYVPYSFNDPNNPNPLSQRYQSDYISRDVIFESYTGTTPRPTLYTYYTNFQRQTTPKSPQNVDAYLVNYKPGHSEVKPRPSPQYDSEQLSSPNYSSSGNKQSNNGQGYASEFENDAAYKKPYNPTNNFENNYRPGDEYTTWSSVYGGKIPPDVNNHDSSRPVYQRPIHADHDGWPTVSSYQKESVESSIDPNQNHPNGYTRNPVEINTPRPSSSGRPILNDKFLKNRNNYYGNAFSSTPSYNHAQNNYHSPRPSYQTSEGSKPSKIHSVTVTTESLMRQSGQTFDKSENRVTSEIPKPLTSKTGNDNARRPGQYYYEKNVLHRYPDKIEDKRRKLNVEERHKAGNNDESIDETLINASVRKQVINENGNATNVGTMNRTRNESSDSVTGDGVYQNLEKIFSEEIKDASWSNSASQWLKPQEDSSLVSAMELPKIPSDQSSVANEFPKPIPLRNHAS